MQCTRKVSDNLYWVGADDRRLTCFEGVYGVPEGVSYNSYLLLDDKTVLFDTVDKAVAHVFFENVAGVLNGRKLDYLIVHHMEPDHAATLEDLLYRYPETTVLTSSKAATMVRQFFNARLAERIQIIDEKSVLETGHHVFRFVSAPMVHWPEVIFSYEEKEGILFSADAFGSFGALNGHLFADEVNFETDYLDEARRYYTNIVGKYGMQVQAVLKKAAALTINYVCPLHGLVWRRHFNDFLGKYLLWSSYQPEVKGVTLAYASVYGHTENMANVLAGKLVDRGVPVEMFDTSVIPASYIISSAFKNSHIVLASTTYNNGIFVTMENLISDMVSHNIRKRRFALLENGSWGPTSGRLMRQTLEKIPETSFIDETISILSAPSEKTDDQLEALADKIARETVGERKPAEPIVPQEAVKYEIEDAAFNNLTYGLEILTTRFDGADYGCVVNTGIQVAAGENRKMTVSVINKNHTCEMIRKSGKFVISVLTEDVPFSVFEHFGFRSGRDVDKFADVPYDTRMGNGIRYIPQYTNAAFSCEVIDTVDLETSTLFIGRITEAIRLDSKVPSVTYGYYHAHIKPKKQAPAEQKEGYRCKVCGYFVEGSQLPEDYVCPLCNHGPEDFEYVPAVKVVKKKGFICKVCGYFEPYEGDQLPADFVCPLCNHGPEDFEPAEM